MAGEGWRPHDSVPLRIIQRCSLPLYVLTHQQQHQEDLPLSRIGPSTHQRLHRLHTLHMSRIDVHTLQLLSRQYHHLKHLSLQISDPRVTCYASLSMALTTLACHQLESLSLQLTIVGVEEGARYLVNGRQYWLPNNEFSFALDTSSSSTTPTLTSLSLTFNRDRYQEENGSSIAIIIDQRWRRLHSLELAGYWTISPKSTFRVNTDSDVVSSGISTLASLTYLKLLRGDTLEAQYGIPDDIEHLKPPLELLQSCSSCCHLTINNATPTMINCISEHMTQLHHLSIDTIVEDEIYDYHSHDL
jgi:hypothetical protein